MNNPYRRKFVTKKGEPVTSLKGTFRDPKTGKVRQSATAMVGANGEFNAGNRTELLSAINGLIDMAARGEVMEQTPQTLSEERIELLSEALSDTTGEKWRLLGEEVSDLIYDHVRRQGFLRRVIDESELAAGQLPRARIRKNWAVAHVEGQGGFKPFVTTPREQYFYPPEYYITSHVLVEDKEISQVAGDLLTERLEDGQERVQVQEDAVLRRLLNVAVSASGNQIFFSTFTPAFFQTLRNLIASRGLPVSTALLASDLWNDIIGQTDFANWFDPVTKHELVLTGVLGSILGVTLITDAFVNHDLRVLRPGETYFLSTPKSLGKHFVRQPLKSEPVDQYNIGRPAKGWFLSSIYATCLPNVNAIARGVKI